MLLRPPTNAPLDTARITAGIALSVAQPLIAYLSELTGKGMREVDRARSSDGPLTPADGAFAIWGPLFLGSLTWASWSALPAQRNEPSVRRIGWLACGTYASNIRNGRTGARRLDLPLVSQGAAPIDLIRRPPANENVTTPQVYRQRFFAQAGIRILLSDTAEDLTKLPTVTSTPPVPLGNLVVTPVGGYTPGAAVAPFAVRNTDSAFRNSVSASPNRPSFRSVTPRPL